MFTESDHYELVRLMHRTGLRFADLIIRRFPLSQAQEAFDLFATQRHRQGDVHMGRTTGEREASAGRDPDQRAGRNGSMV